MKIDDIKTVCLSIPGIEEVKIDRNILTRVVTIWVDASNLQIFQQVEFELERWRPVDIKFEVKQL